MIYHFRPVWRTKIRKQIMASVGKMGIDTQETSLVRRQSGCTETN